MSNYNPVQITTDFEERYPGASVKATECAMNLILTAGMLEKRIARLLNPFGLSPATGLALSILADSQESLSPNQIADRLIISRASVTSLIDSLEKNGYVKRQSHRSDRRMLSIELTDAGREVARRFRPVVHQHQKTWLEVLNSQEQERLIDALHRLQASLLGTEE